MEAACQKEIRSEKENEKKNECGELKKHGLPKSTKPEQEKRDGGRNKNTHS